MRTSDTDIREGGGAGDGDAASWLDLSMRMTLDGAAGPFELRADLSVAAGTFVALVGPSGAGKTTLLRLLAGLARPRHGRLRVGGSLWCDTDARIDMPTRRRPIGFVFQDYALFPNMTVRRNVEYAIGRRPPADEVERLLRLVDLEGLQHAYPARLSGGQKQRLALIRALARRPSVLLLDEPLSALDPAMRGQLQDEVKRLHRSFGTTTLLVSHDVSEILRLADRVVRLEQGRVVFDGAPAQAFGIGGAPEALRVTARHMSGPDADGFATVDVDGRTCRLRYPARSALPRIGDTVMLQVDEATPHVPV